MDTPANATHELNSVTPSARSDGNHGAWHVLWTRSHSEQLVYDQLVDRGYRAFLPTIGTWTRRNGMRYHATVPMFAGYLFLCHQMSLRAYVDVCTVRGLVKLLGSGWDRLAVVPDREMEAVHKLHSSQLEAAPHPYIQTGQRVRVVGGLLAGAEGILVRANQNKGLFVVSIDLLQRSVAVEMDSALVVPA